MNIIPDRWVLPDLHDEMTVVFCNEIVLYEMMIAYHALFSSSDLVNFASVSSAFEVPRPSPLVVRW